MDPSQMMEALQTLLRQTQEAAEKLQDKKRRQEAEEAERRQKEERIQEREEAEERQKALILETEERQKDKRKLSLKLCRKNCKNILPQN